VSGIVAYTVTATSGLPAEEQGLATGLTTMTQLVALTIGIPVIGAIAGGTSLGGLHRGLLADVAVNAVVAAALWVALRPSGQASSGAAAAAQPAPPSAGHGGAPGRAPDQPRNGTAEALAELAGSTAAAPIEPTVVVPQPALSNGGEPDFQTVPVDQLPDRLRRLLDLIVRRGSIGTSEHMDSHGISHRTGLRDLQILVKMGLVERVGQRRGARYRPINRPSPK